MLRSVSICLQLGLKMDKTKDQTLNVQNLEDLRRIYAEGQKYSKHYELQQALTCFLKAFHFISSISNPDEWLKQCQFDVCLHICDIYIHLSEWSEATEFCEKAKDQAEQIQEQIKIARCLDRQGDIKKLNCDVVGALHDYLESLRIKKSYADDSNYKLDISNSFNHIGLIYNYQGKFKEALIAIQNSLKIRVQVLNEDHFDVAMSYNNLGLVYSNLRKLKIALFMYNKALEIRKRILDPMHPSIATTYNNIGTVYKDLAKYEEAEKLLNESLMIQTRNFGQIHKDIAVTYSNMGSLYNDQKKFDKAIAMYQKSLDIELHLFGKNHCNIAMTYSNMGSIYFNDGKFYQALVMYQKSLEILEKGKHDTLDTAVLLTNIATVHLKTSQFDQALSESIKAIDIMKQFFGDTHLNLVGLYSIAAQCYEKLSYHDKALKMQEKLKNINFRYSRSYSSNKILKLTINYYIAFNNNSNYSSWQCQTYKLFFHMLQPYTINHPITLILEN